MKKNKNIKITDEITFVNITAGETVYGEELEKLLEQSKEDGLKPLTEEEIKNLFAYECYD